MPPFPDGTSSTAYFHTQYASEIQDVRPNIDLTYKNNLEGFSEVLDEA
jgi:hypothetical protein